MTFDPANRSNKRTSRAGLQFKILAPGLSDVPDDFANRQMEPEFHQRLLSDVQMVRGLALKECGTAGYYLLPDGRHFQPVDANSWHILLQDETGKTLGCARYRHVSGGPEHTSASQSSISQLNPYGAALKSGIKQLMATARERAKQFGEVGGWALRQESRGTMAAFNVALMTCALAEHLGCGVGITTATTMHHSSAILCRIGAQRLAGVPAYYERNYGSVIEVLHFELPNSNPSYASKLDNFREEVLKTPVICARAVSVANLSDAQRMTYPMPGRHAA